MGLSSLWDRLRWIVRGVHGLPAAAYDLVTEEPELAAEGPDMWAPFDGPLGQLPRNTREILEVYGDPRGANGKVSRKWERANMMLARDLPIPRGKLYVHRLVEPYLREALRRCVLVDPNYIERIGCFCFRHMRHDPSRPLSRHSWGIAVDINPRDNRSRRYARGEAPEAWSDEWKEIWPKGVTKAFVEAWTSVGWAWGGDWDGDGTSTDHTYLDAMHVELVDRKQ